MDVAKPVITSVVLLREHLKVRHLQKDVAPIEASQVARGGKLTDLDSIQLPRMKELSGH